MARGIAAAAAPGAPAPARGGVKLADAIKGGRGLPSRVIFHGQAGIGKTTVAAQAPSPLFILTPGETGLHTLIDAGQLPEVPNLEVSTWTDLLGLIEELADFPGDKYRTLVLDTLDGAEDMANEYVCQTAYNGDWGEKGFGGYKKGYEMVANGPWKGFLQALDRLRVQKKMGIILLAHTEVVNFKNPDGPDYNRWVPNVYKDSWALSFGWADIVLFGQVETVASKERGDAKATGASTGIRMMFTEWAAAYDAKNRHGLPPEIPMGTSGREAWANFTDAIKAAKGGGK